MHRLALTLVTFLAATAPASAQTFDILHRFDGYGGGTPYAGLALDAAGNLYGTTSSGGGQLSFGTVFRLSPNSNGTFTHTELLNFDIWMTHGMVPYGRITVDPNGNLLGTTHLGGPGDGGGTVFRLAPYVSGSGGPGKGGGTGVPLEPNLFGDYTPATLWGFNTSTVNGPASGVTLDSAGNLFGTTVAGGTAGHGTAYRLTPDGNGGYVHSVLANFTGPNGSDPWGGVAVDGAGNAYGTTRFGGGPDHGTVFRLSPDGVGGYTQTILHSFVGTDGSSPFFNDLLLDASGSLFGTTIAGGSADAGTIFRLTPDGAGGFTFSTVFNFNGANGRSPVGDLVMDIMGNIFGVTASGGASGNGTIFRLNNDGAGNYTHTLLYSLDYWTEGGQPYGGLISDGAGNLYGTTSAGGFDADSGSGYGTVFRLSNAGFVVASNEPPTATPEPASLAILSLAVLSLAATRRRHPAAA